MICPGCNQVCAQMSSIDKEDTANTKAPWLETGLDLVYPWAVVGRVGWRVRRLGAKDKDEEARVRTRLISVARGRTQACLSVGRLLSSMIH